MHTQTYITIITVIKEVKKNIYKESKKDKYEIQTDN